MSRVNGVKAGIVKQVIMSSAYWTLNKNMVTMFGLESAMLLSTFAEAESLLSNTDGWFYQTHDKVEEITTLSRHKQDKCIRQLINLEVLQQENRGMPMKRYFRIDYEVLATLLANFQQPERNSDVEPIVETEDEDMKDTSVCKKSTTNFVKNRQPTLLKIDNQLCKKLTTIKNIDKEAKNKEPNDRELGSLRSPDPLEKDSDFSPKGKESKVLSKQSKYSKEEKLPPLNLEEVVAQASRKSIASRELKSHKPRKVSRNATTILAYFAEKFKETLGGIAPLELGKDKALLKQMIEHYGYETVETYIDWMFRNWGQFRRECKLNGVPTVGMLFGFRGYLQDQTMNLPDEKEEVSTGIWGV